MSTTITANNMTPSQRAQVIRSARKIEQILGSSPKIVDNDDMQSVSSSYATDNVACIPEFRKYGPAAFRATAFLSSASRMLGPQSKKRRYSSPHIIRGVAPVLHLAASGNHCQESSEAPRFTICARLDSNQALVDTMSLENSPRKSPRITRLHKLRKRLGDGVPANLVQKIAPQSNATEEEGEEAPVIITEAGADFELVNPHKRRRVSVSSSDALKVRPFVPAIMVTDCDSDANSSDDSSSGSLDHPSTTSSSTQQMIVDEKFRFELPVGFQSKFSIQETKTKYSGMRGWFKMLVSA